MQVVATQLTHWPPCTMPTEKVQSSVVMPSMATIWRAISRIAERPGGERGAGMARLADGFEIEAGDGISPGHHAVVGAAGSGTSTYLLRAASASMMSRVDGVPTSSSGVNSTVIGSGVVNAARASCRMASRVR